MFKASNGSPSTNRWRCCIAPVLLPEKLKRSYLVGSLMGSSRNKDKTRINNSKIILLHFLDYVMIKNTNRKWHLLNMKSSLPEMILNIAIFLKTFNTCQKLSPLCHMHLLTSFITLFAGWKFWEIRAIMSKEITSTDSTWRNRWQINPRQIII